MYMINGLQKKIILLLEFLFVPFLLSAQVSTIKIESANKTEYVKDETNGTEKIVLTGSVKLSVTKDSSSIEITASNITFDRSTSMLYAEGNIRLSSTVSGDKQNISAQSLLLNTNTMEGIFDGGKVLQVSTDAINVPSGSSLVVFADLIGRDSSETIAFKDATLSFCGDDDPHWKIKASNIWLLPGGEFAFFNSLLYIGNIPIMWLPAFYYPKDELIFNPTFGYDTRKGYYFQTTTYLLGRKGLDSGSSSSSSADEISSDLYNFIRSTTLKEQVREGLVLHNLSEDYKGDTTNFLKVKADYYTTLGGMIGIEGVYKPSSSSVQNISGFLDVGFSRTVFMNSSTNSYMPYSNKNKVYWDKTDFFGLKLPIRYGAEFNFSVSKPFNFSLSLPFYSDPYFIADFGERSEYMDWIGFLMSSASSDTTSTSVTGKSSFTWNANASHNFTVPKYLDPYITAISLSSLNSSVVFGMKSTTNFDTETSDDWKYYTPFRSFYYPSQVVPFSVSGRIAGTILQYNSKQNSSSAAKPNFPFPLIVPKEFTDPDEGKASGESKTEKENASEETSEEKEEPMFAAEKLPDLAHPSASLTNFSGLVYTLDYSVQPSISSQLNYNSEKLNSSSDFKWNELQSSLFQMKAPASISSSLSYRNSFLTMSNTFNISPAFQNHPNLDGYDDSAKNEIKKTDLRATSLSITNSNSVSFKPFIYNPVFKDTGLSWDTNLKILQTKFLDDINNPEWEYMVFDVTDKEKFTKNNLSATLGAQIADNYSQTLTLTTTLPPQTDIYSGTLNLTFPYSSFSLSSGIEKNPETSEWEFQPFRQSFSTKLFGSLNLSESFNYKIEEDYADSLRLSAVWNKFNFSYTMAYTYKYDFDSEKGWQVSTEKEFLPETLSAVYSTNGSTFRFWKNRISLTPGMNTSLVYDCLRPTNSYFKFVPSLNFTINDFLKLSFSSESKNSVIYRYFQNENSQIRLNGETNMFRDLLNSFAFWGDGIFYDPNKTLRKNSGFKLKSLKMTLTHELCDWDLSASYSISPRLVTVNGRSQYNFDPYFTLAVTWKPMSAMKAEIVDNYGEWQLNP